MTEKQGVWRNIRVRNMNKLPLNKYFCPICKEKVWYCEHYDALHMVRGIL